MDNCIFVVGGYVNLREFLLFQQKALDKDHTNSSSNASCLFPNSSWMVEPHLPHSTKCIYHAVVKVGLCLVVAGGSINLTTQMNLVEVLDVQWGIV